MQHTTIVVPLSGRWGHLDKTLKWLSGCDPAEFRILLINGTNCGMDTRVKDFARRDQVGLADLPYLPFNPSKEILEFPEINGIVGAIYNMAIGLVDTKYMLTLEDDCLPVRGPRKLFARLSPSLDDQCITAGTLYKHRQRQYCWCGWKWDNEIQQITMLRRNEAVPYFAGHGFGCSLMLTEAVREIGFDMSGDHVDVSLSRRIWQSGRKQRLDCTLTNHDLNAIRMKEVKQIREEVLRASVSGSSQSGRMKIMIFDEYGGKTEIGVSEIGPK